MQVRGEIDDDHSAGAFAAELTAACELGTGVVLVDLDRCVHLGAAALRALAEATARSTRKGFRLRITAQRPPLITALIAHGIPREIVAGGGTALTLVPDSQPDASPAPAVSRPALRRI